MCLEYLNCKELIFRNLVSEAKESVNDLETIAQELLDSKAQSNVSKSKLNKIYTNLTVRLNLIYM